MAELKAIDLDVAGLGMILYSPFAARHIADGEDYLSEKYWEPDDVAAHVRAGTIAGFCTGSPGRYQVRLFDGRPSDETMADYPMAIRLAVQVQDQTVCVRDLYDLHDWRRDCPAEQTVHTPDGDYVVTVLSRLPESGIVGDEQEILIYLDPAPELPKLTWTGVPMLGD